MGRALKRANKRAAAQRKVTAQRPTPTRRQAASEPSSILGVQDAAARRTYRSGGKATARGKAGRRPTEKPLKWREGRE